MPSRLSTWPSSPSNLPVLTVLALRFHAFSVTSSFLCGFWQILMFALQALYWLDCPLRQKESTKLFFIHFFKYLILLVCIGDWELLLSAHMCGGQKAACKSALPLPYRFQGSNSTPFNLVACNLYPLSHFTSSVLSWSLSCPFLNASQIIWIVDYFPQVTRWLIFKTMLTTYLI